MRRFGSGALSLLASLVAVLSIGSRAHAIDLTTAGGFVFDVEDGFDGTIGDGTRDAYDGVYEISVNGTRYDTAGMAPTLTLSGRNVVMREMPIGMLRLQRQVYVPAVGGDFCRILDIVSNTGTAPVTATILIRGNTGSDDATRVMASSSGDMVLSIADAWFTTDDTDGSLDPSLGHVLQGATTTTRAATASISRDIFTWTFSVTVPAGGRIALLTFGIQKNAQAAAQAEARALSELSDVALVGLDEYLDDIINFQASRPGEPRIRFDGPFDAAEGDAINLSVSVMDPEGTTPTWRWDTNNDGRFEELPNGASYAHPAGMTDGPGELRVGVEATDGVNTVQRYRTVIINNVMPSVTSPPPATGTSVGANYRYPIVVDDPAGAADPLTYRVARGPDGMSVSGSGVVSWMPDERDVTEPGESISVEIAIDDGDMGVTSFAWQITVSPNRVPSTPMALYPRGGIGIVERSPRLVVANAMDGDLDTLMYRFEVDLVPTLDSPSRRASALQPSTTGYSFWHVDPPLEPGIYFWRGIVSDGAAEVETSVESFYVVPVAQPMPDGGVPDAGETTDASRPTPMPPAEDGCSVGGAHTRGTPSGAPLLLIALLGLCLRARTGARRGARRDAR